MSLTPYLTQLLIPLNFLVAALLAATVFFVLRWRRLALASALCGLLWAGFWSIPITTIWVGGHLENQYTYKKASDTPTADAIVVLGGHTANNRHNWFEPLDQAQTTSRIQWGAELYQAKRAPIIMVSGAALDGGTSEAQVMARYLRQHQIADAHILIEEQSFTTKENALYSAQQLRSHQLHTVLLVTSALHMPRSMAAFRKEGLNVIPAPVAPQISLPQDSWTSLWRPNLEVMYASRSIIKEYAGLFVYWLRRWI